MARVTHVKAAQPRYKMVPVLDADGRPKTVTVQRKRATKRGSMTHTKRLTVADKDQPLPLLKCDYCHQDIKIGKPYKWVQTKTTYGGIRRNRHASCPTWQPWDLSQSLSARIQQIQHQAGETINETVGDGLTEASEAQDALEDAASEAESLADEKDESAGNIEEGFGHETETSQMLKEQAEELRAWAETMRSVDIPDAPDKADYEVEKKTPAEGESKESTEDDEDETNEAYEDAMESWRDEVRDALQDAVDDCNVG